MNLTIRFMAPLTAVLLAAPISYAQGDIFKCTSAAGVSFQSTPCENDAVMVKIATAKNEPASLVEEDDEASAPVVKPVKARPGLTSRSDVLESGMTDLQVLNNRRWGKPQRITRNRESRAWHEHWTYQTGANGGKQLHFINGVLAGVENLEPAKAEAPSMVSVLMVNNR